ncbi:hypothetical protein ACFSCW_09780 [Sphingomonas tabacisoli]|uniref:Uncharacterized protein n=1 Tax=Sphingomonas tabacisoli TaxID=2249466 RepID=A0ABW4I2V2_9SPHN
MSLSSVALVALAAASPSVESGEQSFTRDGVTYIYTARESGPSTILNGRVKGGSTFRYVVRNGYVTGYFGMTPVSFRAEPAKKPRVEVVSR